MPSKSRGSSAKKNLPLVVHLGNIGAGWFPRSPFFSRTAQRAARFPRFHHLGIDIRKPVSARRLRIALQALPPEKAAPLLKSLKQRNALFRRNLSQSQATFAKGLARLRNNSAERIESVLGVGHYLDSGKEITSKTIEAGRVSTQKIIGLTFSKLKPGGKLVFVVGNQAFPIIQEAIRQFPFERIKTKELREDAQWTPTLSALNDHDAETSLVEYFPVRVVVAWKPLRKK